MPSLGANYFRRDQEAGITAPDLGKDCTLAEHVVRARGKRSRYTSVSLDLQCIKDFGPVSYKYKKDEAAQDRHRLVEHDVLLRELRKAAQNAEKAEKVRAVQALRYSTRRKEGLVDWQFSLEGVDRKDLIAWASRKIQPYFARVS